MATEEERTKKWLRTRQFLLLFMLLACSIPLLYPIGLPVTVSSYTKKFYNYIESLDPKKDVIWFAFDYEIFEYASLEAYKVVFEHLAQRRIQFVISTLNPWIMTLLWKQISETHYFDLSGLNYGTDYVLLKYVGSGEVILSQFAKDIRSLIPTDYFGTPLAQIPLMNHINKATDFSGIIYTGSASDMYDRQIRTIYKLPYYFINSPLDYTNVLGKVRAGILDSFLNGASGAAEYEFLVGKPGRGIASMDAYSVTMILIFVFVGSRLIRDIYPYASKRFLSTKEKEV